MGKTGFSIAHSCPDLGKQEIKALVACARSLQLKGGERMLLLEDRVSKDLGYSGAVSTTTGSQAIHLALRASFPGHSALVGLPSYLCRSVHDAIRLAGCRPYLLDIDPLNFSASLENAAGAGLDAIVIPHMFGIRAPVEAFLNAGFIVIEDCAQRLPPLDVAGREPKPHVRILSFEATKLITCGEGGILLSDDSTILKRARQLRDAPYDFTEPAVSLPLTDLQASMAMIQWHRLPVFLSRRRRIAEYYTKALRRDGNRNLVSAMLASDTYHFRFVLWVDDPVSFIKFGSKNGVMFKRPVAPAPLHALFADGRSFPNTDRAFDHLVSIPLYPKLTPKKTALVVNTAKEALSKVSCKD